MKQLQVIRLTLQMSWQAWKRIGRYIGDMIGRVVLTVFYFSLFMPFGIGVRLFSDPLEIRPGVRTSWSERKTHNISLEDSRRLS
jgi:hypothetical protein